MRIISGLLFLFVFAAAIAGPGIVTVMKITTGGEENRSDTERRRLATVSALSRDISRGEVDLINAGPAFGEAFKDQLAYRGDVTRQVNSVLINTFAHSTHDEIKIGRGNFWFQLATPSFHRLACAAPSGPDVQRSVEMLRSYKAFEERAATLGVKTYLVIVPMTTSIYADHLPQPMRERCDTDQTTLQRALAQAGDVGRVAYDLEWFRRFEPGEIYDPRAFHWHRPGAINYLTYLVEDGLLKGDRRLALLGPARERPEEIDNASDLGVAPLDIIVMDNALREPPERTLTGLDLPPQRQEDFQDIFRNDAALRTLLMTEGGQQSGTGVLVGDSFTSKFWPYYSRHFETAYRFHASFLRLQHGMLDRIVEETEPDYLVILLTEPKWTFAADARDQTAFERILLEAEPAN
ncbi:MAG: hypothetical protein MRY64_13880 [Hyphomonadaceae bacterium]|nr:hypothetical protein [Hyphomonadaceae bacterium]